MNRINEISKWIGDQFSGLNTRNLKIVLLCLIGATIFWLFNALNKSYTTDINLPLEFEYNREEHVVLSELPDEIVVNVTGGGWDLLRKTNLFNVKPIQISIDPAVQKQIAGPALVPTVDSYLTGLELNYIVTDTLHLNIDRKVTRKLPIEIDSANINLEENYAISSPIRSSYDTITVTGPGQYLDTLMSQLVLKIPESNIDEDYDKRVTVPLGSSRLIVSSPQSIRVQFEVEEVTEIETEIRFNRINFPEQPQIQLSDTTVSVLIKVLESDREGVEDRLNIMIDYNLVDWNDSTVIPVVRSHPTTVKLVRIESGPLKLIYE